MSFKNFLDLRKKTDLQIKVVERIILQKRSWKSDIFLILSVIFVASAIIWGISMADYSPQTDADYTQTTQTNTSNSAVIPAEAGIQSESPESAPTPSVIPDPIGSPSSSESDSMDQEYFSAEKFPDHDSARQPPSLCSETLLSLPHIREDDTGSENDNVGINVATDTSTTQTQQTFDEQNLDGQVATETPATSTPANLDGEDLKGQTGTTGSIVSNILDTVKDFGNGIKDAVTGAIDNVNDLLAGTSTATTTQPTLAPQNLDGQAIQVTEQNTDSGKLVTVSSPNEDSNTPIVDVLASTTIPKIYKVGEENKIQIKWKNNGDQNMSFRATDTNGDDYIDLVEWTIPHLSTQIFEIIFISKAFQLDSNLNILADIYDTVRTKDGNFANISDGQYVRVTFEKTLTNKNDVTLFARSTDSLPTTNSSIEVYPVYKDQDGNNFQGPSVATFSNISEAKTYKVLLTDLENPTDIFDLKIVGNIDIDYVVDPTIVWTGATSGDVSVGTNYSGDTLPLSGDTVTVASSATNMPSSGTAPSGVIWQFGAGTSNNAIIDINNSGSTLPSNTGTVNTNNGTITTSAGIVGMNVGTITTNAENGVVTTNYMTITENASGATVNTNANGATIVTNNGTLTYQNEGIITNSNTAISNASTGYVDTSWATISNNYGTVNYNNNIVSDNYGTVNSNYNTVTTNQSGGVITENYNNMGVVVTNNGIVTFNNSGATITTNSGSVYTNNGIITTNVSTGYVKNYSGTVGTNDAGGSVYITAQTNLTCVIGSNSGDAYISQDATGDFDLCGLQIKTEPNATTTLNSLSATGGNSLELTSISNLIVSSEIVDIPITVSGTGVTLTASVSNTGSGNAITINSGASITIAGNITIVNSGVGIQNYGTITDITGTVDNKSGGVGINNGFSSGGTITNISGSVVNESTGTGIVNYDTITDINGIFTNSGSGYGIYSYGTITDISGNFTNSGDESSVGIVNDSGTITDISGDFTNTGAGNGVNNDGGVGIIDIRGDFLNSGSGKGINNSNNILDISGNIENSGAGYGIYNNDSATITDISGDVTNNSTGYGINNNGTITNISGSVINNGEAGWGIVNNNTITDISGNVTNNSTGYGIESSGTIVDISGILNNNGNGAGIYNTGSVSDITGTIINIGTGNYIWHDPGTLTSISGTIYNFLGGSSVGLESVPITTLINLPVADGKIWTNASSTGEWNNSNNWLLGVPANKTTDNIILSANMTLPSDITGDVYFANDGITLNGDDNTTTGNIIGVNGNEELGFNPATKGFDVALSNVTVTGTVTAGSAGVTQSAPTADAPDGGNVEIANSIIGGAITAGTGGIADYGGGENLGGVGGYVEITNSTTTSITAGDAGSTSAGGPGVDGGYVTIINSNVSGNIKSGNGGTSGDGLTGGNGGNIIISGTNLNFSSKSITAGVGGYLGGLNGSLTLTYQGLTTNTSTYLYDIGALTINGTSGYIDTSGVSTTCTNGVEVGVGCAWNGLFNPLIFYFNNAVNTDWGTLGNWWNDVDHTVQASSTPLGFEQVIVNGIIGENSGDPAKADTIVFNGTSSNSIEIIVRKDVTFNEYSTNLGTITAATSTFYNNDTWASIGGVGTIISDFIQRIFNSSATSTHNFTNEGGKNSWVIKAIGNIVVNIADSTYNLANNLFQATLGAVFYSGSNSAGQPTPTIIITSPTSGTNIKWAPSIDWGNATTCFHSYDGFDTTTELDCDLDGSDIPRPAAGVSKTLSLRGINTVGGHDNLSETSVTYTYNNTSPVWTSCGINDPLDEGSTREYYYLENGAVTGDCYVYSSTTLYGSSTTTLGTGTLTGQVIASATSTTNGYNITLRNITVTGTTTSNGGTTGKNGGNITVYNATVGSLVTNGGANAGGAGGNAGTTTVATSTTSRIYANGGNGTSQGGNGGAITVWNSDGILAGTIAQANGGNASSNCGTVGQGGDINITNSDNYTAESIDGTATCNSVQTGGQHRTPIVTPRPTPTPTTPSPTQTPSSNSGSRSFIPGIINPITLPVQMLKPIKLTNLPTFGEDKKGSFSFLTAINNFLFAPLPKIFSDSLSPKLVVFLKSIGITKEQDLINIQKKPIELDEKAKDIPGIWTAYASSIPTRDSKGDFTSNKDLKITSRLSGTKKDIIFQTLKVPQNTSFTVSLTPSDKRVTKGNFLNKEVTFTKSNNKLILNITAPKKPGTYTLTTKASPLPLVIEVTRMQTNTTDNGSTASKGIWGTIKSIFGW